MPKQAQSSAMVCSSRSYSKTKRSFSSITLLVFQAMMTLERQPASSQCRRCNRFNMSDIRPVYTHAGPTHAEKDIVQRDGILSVTGVAAFRTDLHEHGRTRGSGIDQKARENDAVLVGGDKGGVAVDGAQRGETKSHDHRAGTSNAERLGEVIDAGGEEQMLATGQLCVEGRGGVAGVGDVKAIEGDRHSGRRARAPRDAGALVAQLRHTNEIAAPRIDGKKGLFAHQGSPGDLGVRRRGRLAGWRRKHADEDHIPIGASPTAPLAVARDPLLLGAGVDVAVHYGVRHPAAAGPTPLLVQY